MFKNVFIASHTIMKLTLYFCFLSIQLQCCGIEGPHDWDQNVYFNCSSASVGSREACGVPFSCCKPKVDELIKNVQCGYDVRRQDYVSFLIIICKKKTRKANLSSIKLLTTCFHEKRIQNSMNLFAKTCGGQHIRKKTKFFSPKIMQMQPGDYTQVIYDRGCLRSGEEWVERNLVPVAAVAVALAVLQASNKLQLFFFAHHSFFL